jgi:hypothetical protein
MGGAPLLHILCTGEGPGGGGLALLCGPWAGLQFPTANVDVTTFGASWVGGCLAAAAREAGSTCSSGSGRAPGCVAAMPAGVLHCQLQGLPSSSPAGPCPAPAGRLQRPVQLELCPAGHPALHMELHLS